MRACVYVCDLRVRSVFFKQTASNATRATNSPPYYPRSHAHTPTPPRRAHVHAHPYLSSFLAFFFLGLLSSSSDDDDDELSPPSFFLSFLSFFFFLPSLTHESFEYFFLL